VNNRDFPPKKLKPKKMVRMIDGGLGHPVLEIVRPDEVE